MSEQKNSALARFNDLFKSEVKIESFGSPVRSRYSIAIATFLLSASMQVGAAALPDVSKVDSSTFGQSDLMTSTSSQKNQKVEIIDIDAIDDMDADAKMGLKLMGPQARLLEAENGINTCALILPKQHGGNLLFDDLMKKINLPHLTKDQKTSNDVMIDRFIFYHEAAHCENYNFVENSKDGLGKNTTSKLKEFNFQNKAVINNNENAFATTLLAERFSDSSATLNLAHYMLVQKNMPIENFNNAIDSIKKLREVDKNFALSAGRLDDHKTTDILELTRAQVNDAYSSGKSGMNNLFGKEGASLQEWSDKRTDIVVENLNKTNDVLLSDLKKDYSVLTERSAKVSAFTNALSSMSSNAESDNEGNTQEKRRERER